MFDLTGDSCLRESCACGKYINLSAHADRNAERNREKISNKMSERKRND